MCFYRFVWGSSLALLLAFSMNWLVLEIDELLLVSGSSHFNDTSSVYSYGINADITFRCKEMDFSVSYFLDSEAVNETQTLSYNDAYNDMCEQKNRKDYNSHGAYCTQLNALKQAGKEVQYLSLALTVVCCIAVCADLISCLLRYRKRKVPRFLFYTIMAFTIFTILVSGGMMIILWNNFAPNAYAAIDEIFGYYYPVTERTIKWDLLELGMSFVALIALFSCALVSLIIALLAETRGCHNDDNDGSSAPCFCSRHRRSSALLQYEGERAAGPSTQGLLVEPIDTTRV